MAVTVNKTDIAPNEPGWLGSGILIWHGNPHGSEQDIKIVTMADHFIAIASCLVIIAAVMWSESGQALGIDCLVICALFGLRTYVRARRSDHAETHFAITTEEVIRSTWKDNQWVTDRMPLSQVAKLHRFDASGGLGTIVFQSRLGAKPSSIEFTFLEHSDNVYSQSLRALDELTLSKLK
jgi:hypothetical protein